ncbi:unknown [Clostridium sp. CAG:798]|jgi:Na+/proline symporter|nr:unknown [Clostridium sp. CAG:798]
MKSIINKITIILILVLLLLMLTSSSYAIGDMMNAASNFLEKGEEPENDGLNMASLQDASQRIYMTFFIIGIAIAILVGAILGIKIMVGTVEEKAEIKKMLVPYIAGCIVLFTAFTIWKFVVTIGNNVLGN